MKMARTASDTSLASDSVTRTVGIDSPKTNEEHWIDWAIKGYVAGKTTIEEFEQAMWDALHNRQVNFDGSPHRP